MKKLIFALLCLMSFHSMAWVQQLPACEELSKLWVDGYYNKLRPNWGYGPLPCQKDISQMTDLDKVKIITARAAYVLDRTVFNYRLPTTPIVSYGRIQAPPKSMLNWVAQRIEGMVFDRWAKNAYTSLWTYKIHLTADDFHLNENKPMEMGLGLAGQLIHEARHAGKPVYRHVQCTIPEASGPNCDPTISEEFEGGGSHAVAALWLAYVAKNSFWPESERNQAKETVKWVLQNRINDSYEVKNAFSQRYLWENL